MATTMAGGATTIAGLVASKFGVAALLGPALGGAVIAGATVWIAAEVGGYVWNEFIHPDLPVEEQLAAIEVASMIINHFDIVNATPAEVVKTLFGDNKVKEMDFDRVIKIYQHLIKIAKGDTQAGDSINNLESLVLNMEDNKEALEQFTSIKNAQFILVQESNKQAIIQHASENSDVGIAYRYALKELQPFVIGGNNVDYSKFNQNGELELASKNYPNGMTDMYIKKRAEMLTDLIKDNEVGTYRPNYVDMETGTTLNSTGTDSSYVIFGTDANDRDAIRTLASQENDYIFAGGGNDDVFGGKGNDYLEGGTGNDTYHIKDHDTIYDIDADGTVIIDDATVGYLAWQKSNGRWESNDGEVVAIRDKDNLIVTKGDDQATITDFFTQISIKNDTYSGYGISLGSDKEKAKATELNAEELNPNDKSMHIWASGDFDFTLTGGKNSDRIMATTAGRATIKAGDGRDSIYGSLNNDIIDGGKGNDVIYGAPALIYNKDKSTFVADADVISGGEGSDIILGRVGDDVLYANDDKAYKLTEASSEQGDWVNGDLGNDKIFGSQSADMLQGGAGVDTIRGGASADVIIGDGNSELTIRSIWIPDDAGNISSIRYDYNSSEQKWEKTTQSVYSIIHLNTAKWSVEIEDGNYSVESYYNLPAAVHRVETGGMADFLFGDGGNDLIIGQDGNDYLYGGTGDDVLWGDDNRDLTIAGNDRLEGNEGEDTLNGGLGDDTLVGGTEKDKLLGGEGFDTYVFATEHLDAVDTITDSDGRGEVYVSGKSWSAQTWTATSTGSQTWKDDTGNTLALSGGQLTLTTAGGQGVAVIENFSKGDLGFDLQSNENKAPETVGSLSGQDLTTTEAWSLATASAFSDADGDTLSYSATLADGSALPSWLQINTSTGQLSGTPSTAEQLSLIVTATDPSGETAQQTVTLNIVKPNTAPAVNESAENFEVTEKTPLTITLSENLFSDADNDVLTYTVTQADGSALPAWLSYDDTSRILSGTPDEADMGELSLKITATDPSGASVSQGFTLTDDGIIEGATQVDGEYIGTPGDDLAQGGKNNDSLKGRGGNDRLYGGGGDDKLFGNSGRDTLYGNEGNDIIKGGKGADTLIGGTGNDKLFGGKGDDTFIIHKGDGQDVIHAGNDDFNDNDSIRFEAIDSGEVRYRDDGKGNLIISGYSDDDQVKVKNFFSDNTGSISHLVFSDKTLDYDAILRQPIVQRGTNGDDYLQAKYDNAILKGLGGDDHLVGSNGNNVLIGGKGNDYLEGNSGINTYQFSKGDGHDTIVEYNEQNSSKLTLTDVLTSAVNFGKDGDDLILFGYGDNSGNNSNGGQRGDDSITIKDFYSTTPAMSNFQFADGTVTANAILDQRVSVSIL